MMHLKPISDLNHLMNEQQVADSKQVVVQQQVAQLIHVQFLWL